jgi:hypothetical protein
MNPFSTRIREEVVAAYPEWEPFVTSETYKGSLPYLVIKVPTPPEARTNHPLRISTWDDEITVDFDYYHTHFERWNPAEGDDRNQSALLFIKAIVKEQLAAASWWQGEYCKLCAQIEPGASLNPPFNVAYSKIRVRSWKGSHNADIDP